jgi:hypothetical protein
MKIIWKLTHEVSPDVAPGPDFTAFDGQEVIGRVRQVEEGPERGLWLWTMTAGQPGSEATSGRAAERGKAGRGLIQAYRKLLAHPTPARVAKRRLSALKKPRD